MKHFLLLTLTFFFLLVFTGCKPEDLRMMTSNSIDFEYNGEQCLPLESFVPPNEDITVSIKNTSTFDFTWHVIIFPISESIGLNDPENTLFSASVPAGQQLDFHFTSPKLTARYDTLCVPDLYPEKRIMKYLLVVDPYPTQVK